ncbi:MAG: hypothetical protein KAS66_08375 [Candidatus Omnitrophica bacterium]|nr:hypothetical protein [Candidatus Omnitrophota bacterium]
MASKEYMRKYREEHVDELKEQRENKRIEDRAELLGGYGIQSREDNLIELYTDPTQAIENIPNLPNLPDPRGRVPNTRGDLIILGGLIYDELFNNSIDPLSGKSMGDMGDIHNHDNHDNHNPIMNKISKEDYLDINSPYGCPILSRK